MAVLGQHLRQRRLAILHRTSVVLELGLFSGRGIVHRCCERDMADPQPEMQGGWIPGLDTKSYDQCLQLFNSDFERVFYHSNIAQGPSIAFPFEQTMGRAS